MSERILIAKITTAHGIKGLVKLHYYGENIEDVKSYNPFYIAETGHDALTINIKNAIKGGYVAAIEGINDRDQAEKLRHTELFIDVTSIAPAEEGEFLQKDLIGCTAYENDIEIGKVIAIENFGAGDLLDIQPAGAESFYLPFQDEFVESVDIKNKKITVIIPEGLIG